MWKLCNRGSIFWLLHVRSRDRQHFIVRIFFHENFGYTRLYTVIQKRKDVFQKSGFPSQLSTDDQLKIRLVEKYWSVGVTIVNVFKYLL